MFSDLADTVSRNGKVILAIWVMLIIILVPSAFKSFDMMGYDVSDMADSDSESVRADALISRYFDDSRFDVSDMQLLVVEYYSRDGYRQLQGDSDIGLSSYSDYVTSAIMKDSKWIQKMDSAVLIRSYSDGDEGALLIGFHYKESYSGDASGDTASFRESISSLTDSYMYELYEPNAFFSVHITGDGAMIHDMADTAYGTIVLMLVLLFVVTMVLAGLFFGNATASFIALASMVSSAVPTMAVVLGFCSMFGVYFINGFLDLLAVVAISFVHSMYIIAAFRDELRSSVDRDAALKAAIMRTSGSIATAGICLFVCTLTLALFGTGLFAQFGACMSAGALVVTISSLTVPSSLIHITRNELFWSEEKTRWAPRQRAYEFLGKAFSTVTERISAVASRKGVAVLTVTVCLVAGSAAYLAYQGISSETPSDMSDSLMVGESKDGFDVLKKYDDGGVLHPFSVVLSYDEPVASISTDQSGDRILTWSYDIAQEMSSLSNGIMYCDIGNISRVVTPVSWSSMVSTASESNPDDYDAMLDDIRRAFIVDDGSRASIFDSAVTALKAKGHTSETIVTSDGGWMDYRLNEALGLIGYEMLSDKSIIVSHLLVEVSTQDSPASARSLDTIESMKDALDSFVASSNATDADITGIGMVYREVMESVDSGFLAAAIYVCAVLVIILGLVTMSVSTPIRMVTTTVAGALLSLCITQVLTDAIWGSTSLTVQVSMISVCAVIGMWMNTIQENHMARCRRAGMGWKEASADLSISLQPVIVMTAVILAVCFGAFYFCEIQLLSQLGFSLAFGAIIDSFIIRTMVSPAIWSIAGSRRRRTPAHPCRCDRP